MPLIYIAWQPQALNSDWCICRNTFPDFVRKLAAAQRHELCVWWKAHLHFVTYVHDASHSKLEPLLHELANEAEAGARKVGPAEWTFTH